MTNDKGDVIPFPADMVLVLESLASQTAVTIQNVHCFDEMQEMFQSFVRTITDVIGKRTPCNAAHSKHMAKYCERYLNYINKTCGYEKHDFAHKKELLMSVWLHDIGKLVTPLNVMNKAGRLSSE